MFDISCFQGAGAFGEVSLATWHNGQSGDGGERVAVKRLVETSAANVALSSSAVTAFAKECKLVRPVPFYAVCSPHLSLPQR